jgi:hypothetical protein
MPNSYCNILRKLHKTIQRKRPGKSPPASDSSSKNFMLLVFRGFWNDGPSASMYREIMLRNKSIIQISTLVYLSSISICNLLIDSTYVDTLSQNKKCDQSRRSRLACTFRLCRDIFCGMKCISNENWEEKCGVYFITNILFRHSYRFPDN